jgi:hypothetical protein
MSPWQEAEPLARLDRRAREHDPVHLSPRERGHRHRDGEERLARARGADSDGDRRAADRVHVALLVDGLRRDAQAAMAPDDVLEDPARALVTVERAGDRLDRSGRDLVALAHEIGHLPHDGSRHGDRVVVAVERKHVPPEVDLAVEVLLERLHHRVAGACELRGDLVR